MRHAILIAAIAVAVPAQAQYAGLGSLTPRQHLLDGAQGASAGSGGLFLIGLGLAAAGLVLGGAGFAILYLCREGTDCHQDRTLQTVGWVVAAPGIIPLAVGLFLMYISVGGKGGGGTHGASAVSFGLVPLSGGGAFASGTVKF
jgi:hypothetical protein